MQIWHFPYYRLPTKRVIAIGWREQLFLSYSLPVVSLTDRLWTTGLGKSNYQGRRLTR